LHGGRSPVRGINLCSKSAFFGEIKNARKHNWREDELLPLKNQQNAEQPPLLNADGRRTASDTQLSLPPDREVFLAVKNPNRF
jgi:hypothetical protein